MVKFGMFIFILFLGGCVGKIKKPKYLSQKKSELENVNTYYESYYFNYMEYIIPSEGQEIKNNIYVYDSLNKKIYLKDLFLSQKKKKIIFRYSFRDCNLCIDSVFKVLREIKKENLKNSYDIILIKDAKSFRDFKIQLLYDNMMYPTYFLSIDEFGGLGLPIENKNMPILFVMNSKMTVSKIFIPNKDHLNETRKYIKSLIY